MNRKIVITTCEKCPYLDHKGGFANPSYVPICKLSNLELPHTVYAKTRGGTQASATYVIPQTCELEKDV